MKGVKGKLLKRLKQIKPPIGYLKHDRVLLQVNVDGFYENSLNSPNHHNVQQTTTTRLIWKEPKQEKSNQRIREPDIIEEGEEEEMEVDDKENIRPQMKARYSVSCKEDVESSLDAEEEGIICKPKPLSEIDVSSFRRPDMNSLSLFDPNLLAAFQEAVKEYIRKSQEERKARIEQEKLENMREEEAERISRIEQENLEKMNEETERNTAIDQEEPPDIDIDKDSNPLLAFDEKCPPGGDGSVIFYTTSLRGIRKTFEDCSSIRFLLESFRLKFHERDVSMHMEFKEELRNVLDCKALPPKLFIKGRYIGGAAEVLGLHEQGKFRVLFEGIPIEHSNDPCEGCAGFRFVICFKCTGSHKFVADDGLSSICQVCNENGLIICPLCC